MKAGTTQLCIGAILSTVLLLSGCGQVTGQAPAHSPYLYTATVPVTVNDTQKSVEQRYDGTAVVWQPSAGFAILGLKHQLDSGSIKSLGVNATQISSDPNIGIFRASDASSAWAHQPGRLDAAGRAYVWSGGRASVWSGGRAVVWSGGSGVVGGLSQNSAAWNQVGLPAAWAAAPKLGEGVTVAVIDSGIDLSHDMFQGALVGPSDQWDFVGNDAVPQEEGSFSDEAFGHGTNVAGIVLQIAPHAKIMPLRVLNPDGSGDETSVAQAINFAVQHGAQIINLSLGSVQKTNTIQQMIQFATSKGIYVVASSGNTGDNNITYPAAYAQDPGTVGQSLISVGSVDAQDHKSSFSTYGLKLEMVAPGEMVWGPVPGNLCSYWSGTSMATPMVAGALALVRGQATGPKLNTLSTQLMISGTDINRLNLAYPGQLGKRLNVGAFVKAILPDQSLPLLPH